MYVKNYVMKFLGFFKVCMLINVSLSDFKNGLEEFLVVCMIISNVIVDFWIYIILRKENLKKILVLV